jgi:stage III sporulation protein AB
MKAFGSVLIVSGCAFVGMYAALAHKRQLSALKKLLFLLDYMCCELQYKLTPLPELFRKTAQQTCGYFRAFFLDLADELDMQVIPNAQSCLCVVLKKHTAIPVCVQDCLTELGRTLGSFDLRGQLDGYAYARTICKDKIAALEEGKEGRMRTYQTLGLCAGAALAVLLI